MKYIKIFSMIFLSIIMLVAIFFSLRTFGGNRFLLLISSYYINSFVYLIGFIFLLIYTARTKNIYNLVASLFLTTSILIIIFNLNIPSYFRLFWTGTPYRGTEIIIYIISAIVSFVFIAGFITLFFYFKSKSKKYIEQLD
jgi:hypothetical protein